VRGSFSFASEASVSFDEAAQPSLLQFPIPDLIEAIAMNIGAAVFGGAICMTDKAIIDP